MTHIRSLSALYRDDAPLFGGKSSALGELMGAGLSVPPGFALSCAAFDAFVDAAGLGTAITGDDPESIVAAIRATPVPDDLRAEVTEAYVRLGDDLPVAVRSSAIGEDSTEATFAGQQQTILWVHGVDRLCEAIRECWASLYSAPAVSYRARLGERAPRPSMGVAVQRMVDAEAAGVMFTCNPLSGDPSMIAINASWGFGEAIVGGEVTPDDYLISKVTREVVREQLGAKEIEYVVAADGQGTVRAPVPPERRERACLSHESLDALIDIARSAERHFGAHQDIEWAVARPGTAPDRVVVLQSRPVTAIASKSQPAAPASALSLVMGTFGAARRGG